ncbi:MAG: hypothetical protein VW239_00330 [Candidatus Nanopelagicales bacterium]
MNLNYPVTNSYLAERLRRAVEELPKESGISLDIEELARYFQLCDDWAALTSRDQERLADMARYYVQRDESVRRLDEMKRRSGELSMAKGIRELEGES